MLARAMYLLVAGGLGGLLAWMITEPFAPKNFAGDWSRFEGRLGLITGLMIGLLVGGASGLSQGSRAHLIRGAAFGGLVGAVTGPIGLSVASGVFNAIAGPTKGIAGVGIVTVLIARMIGLGIFGGFIGLAEGAVGRSFTRAFQGLIGGLVGGALGGLLFEAAGWMFGSVTVAVQQGDEIGTIPRAVGLTSIGAGIGLLIGVVEALARQAWVRVIYGRNEGKEYIVDAPQNFIGRSERAHIPIFGDASIQPMHAYIERRGGTYTLVDGGSPLGTGLNGQRIGQALLTSGDTIQVGTFQLQFMMRSGRGQRAMGPERFQPAPFPIVPQPTPVSAPGAIALQPTMQMGGAAMTMQAPYAASAAATPVSTTLVAVDGPMAGQRFQIDRAIEVGREGGGLPVSWDTMVSRKHASISPVPGGLQITDLGSTNGTFVNGQRVQSGLLNRGDAVKIGATTFKVE